MSATHSQPSCVCAIAAGGGAAGHAAVVRALAAYGGAAARPDRLPRSNFQLQVSRRSEIQSALVLIN